MGESIRMLGGAAFNVRHAFARPLADDKSYPSRMSMAGPGTRPRATAFAVILGGDHTSATSVGMIGSHGSSSFRAPSGAKKKQP